MTPLSSSYTPTELFGLFSACAGLDLQIWIATVHEPVKETHNMSYEYTNSSVVGSVKNRLKSTHYLSNYEIPAVHCQRLQRDPGMAQSVK